MQSSPNESDSVKFKQMKVDTYTLNSRADVGVVDGWEVCYRSSVKLAGIWFESEASRVSSHTEVLWYNRTEGIYIGLNDGGRG